MERPAQRYFFSERREYWLFFGVPIAGMPEMREGRVSAVAANALAGRIEEGRASVTPNVELTGASAPTVEET